MLPPPPQASPQYNEMTKCIFNTHCLHDKKKNNIDRITVEKKD